MLPKMSLRHRYPHLYTTLTEEFPCKFINCVLVLERVVKQFHYAEDFLRMGGPRKDYADALKKNYRLTPAEEIITFLNGDYNWLPQTEIKKLDKKLMIAYEKDKIKHALPHFPVRLFYVSPPVLYLKTSLRPIWGDY